MSVTPMSLVAAAKENISEISVEIAQNNLSKMYILDVREASEHAGGHLPGAINISRGILEFKISSHPELQDKHDQDIIVYCQSGGRSALATEVLNQLGYVKAVSMAGGYNAWLENGFDIA